MDIHETLKKTGVAPKLAAPSPKTAPACPVCNATKKPILQYIGGRGYTTVHVCPVRWASETDTCEVAK